MLTLKDIQTHKYKVKKSLFIDNNQLAKRDAKNRFEKGYGVGKFYYDYESEEHGFGISPLTRSLIRKGYILEV